MTTVNNPQNKTFGASRKTDRRTKVMRPSTTMEVLGNTRNKDMMLNTNVHNSSTLFTTSMEKGSTTPTGSY